MTVLEITAVPFSYIHSGGGERYPTEMIRELSKLEKVTGCYSSDQGIRILEGDVLIPAKFMDIEPFISYSNPIPTPKSLLVIRNIILSNIKEIEFIHIHNLRTAMSTAWLFITKLLKGSGIKVILTDHNARFFPFPRISVSAVDYYAPVSNFSNQILQSYSKRPFRIFPIPVSSDLIRNNTIKSVYHRDIDLLYLGRIVPWKAPDKIIQIVHYLKANGFPNINAVIAGRIMNKEYYYLLVSMVVKYGLDDNIKFVISPDDNAVTDLYSNSKFHILLSTRVDIYGHKHRSPELSPTTIAEAGIFGTPSIVSSAPGISEQVLDGITGYIVTDDEIHSQSRIVRDALLSLDRWDAISKKVYNLMRVERNPAKIASDFKIYLDDIRAGRV